MEKDQLDSLATVAVGTEKMPPTHSHYASSEVYSVSESPPAYRKPPLTSTSVQITRIIATTMIVISVIIGSSILASAWLQARASCTPESIAAMRTRIHLEQSRNEFTKHPEPEALVQAPAVATDNSQRLSETSSSSGKDEARTGTKDATSKTDNENDSDNGDENDSDEDYDDSEFPPVHLKLPVQLDLDDLAGSLLHQARSIVSCVVEQQRGSNRATDGENNPDPASSYNGTERVAIFCESANPRQDQRNRETPTPIIVPLGTVEIPLRPQDAPYNRYRSENLYQAPQEPRGVPFVNGQALEPRFPVDTLAPELANLPRLSMEMGPPPRLVPQMPRAQSARETTRSAEESQEHRRLLESKIASLMGSPLSGQRPPPQQLEFQALSDESRSSAGQIPIELRRFIQEFSLPINHIIEDITGEARSMFARIPEGTRHEQFDGFMTQRIGPTPLDYSGQPVRTTSFLRPENTEARSQETSDDSENRLFRSHALPNSEDRDERAGPSIFRSPGMAHEARQIPEGHLFPVSRFGVPLGTTQSPQVRTEARVRVSGDEAIRQEHRQQEKPQNVALPQHQIRIMVEEDGARDEADRPHFVQPRSVRSVPETFGRTGGKRIRRRTCNCEC